MTSPSPRHSHDELAEKRRAKTRAAWLARVRSNTPERRPIVKHGRGIVWTQDFTLLAEVLAVKAEREVDR